MAMQTGTVKFFDDKKGYGFITPEGGGPDLFVHFSNIKTSSEDAKAFRTLREGQRVSYTATKGPKGAQATDVQVID